MAIRRVPVTHNVHVRNFAKGPLWLCSRNCAAISLRSKKGALPEVATELPPTDIACGICSRPIRGERECQHRYVSGPSLKELVCEECGAAVPVIQRSAASERLHEMIEEGSA